MHYKKSQACNFKKPSSYKPKKSKNTIQTEAIENGWYGFYLQRYVGHAPKTIGEKHYHGDKNYRMVELYKTKVLVHINQIIQNWDTPHDTKLLKGMHELHDHCTIVNIEQVRRLAVGS